MLRFLPLLEALGMKIVAAGSLAPDQFLALLEFHEAYWTISIGCLAIAILLALFGDLSRKWRRVGEDFLQLGVQKAVAILQVVWDAKYGVQSVQSMLAMLLSALPLEYADWTVAGDDVRDTDGVDVSFAAGNEKCFDRAVIVMSVAVFFDMPTAFQHHHALSSGFLACLLVVVRVLIDVTIERKQKEWIKW